MAKTTEKTSAKIVEFRAEDFKRLSVVQIRPDGAIVPVIGDNDQGKTSLLDGIATLFGGKEMAPRTPIRKGKKEAQLTAELDNGMTVIRNFWLDKDGETKTDLRIVSDGKFLKKPQAVMDAMLGRLTFNPLAFASMDRKHQFEMMKGLVPGFDFEKNAAVRKDAYQARTEANRLASDAVACADAISLPPGRIPNRVDVAKLSRQMAEAAQINGEITTRRQRRVDAMQSITDAYTRIEALEQEIEELTARITSVQSKLDAAAPLPDLIDVSDLQMQIEDAVKINKIVDDARMRDEYRIKVKGYTDVAAALTANIAAFDKAKADAIKDAAMPVPGLAFGDDEILLNGISFEDASGRDKLRVSVALGMAMNPELRIMLIDEASSLDKGGLATIAEMAEAADFQIWLVRVTGDGRTGFIIEDGHNA